MFFLAISGVSLASEILSAVFFAAAPDGLLGFLFMILIPFLPLEQRSASLSSSAE